MPSSDDTRARPSDTPPAGLPAVPGYDLLPEIARGGMGVVYRAWDRTFGREVAVKVMLPGMSAAEFVREARITGRLPHPGIPPVYALGTLPDGRPFLAMKLIRGDTLDAVLKARTDLTADRGKLLAAFEQVCQAVGYAHAQGIVHRDLKPSNVMVGAFGEVQVMDWGLAKAVGGADSEVVPAPGHSGASAAATAAGQVKGTPAYMAPEQARGEPVDQRADVFALGGILSAVLTGHAPFAGTGVLDTIIRAAQADLAETFARLDASGADDELIALAKHCLAATAADRAADGTAVMAAVAAYRAGVDARLRRAEQDAAAAEARAEEERNTRREAEAREREQRKKRRAQLTLVGVVAATLAGAGIATALVLEQRAADRVAAEHQRGEDRRAADRAAAAAQRRARADALVQALGNADTGAVGPLLADLREFRDLTGPGLRALAARPVAEKPGLHARLALLPDEPGRAGELAGYLPACRPDELLPLRDALRPHAGAVAAGLWAVVGGADAAPGERARAAGALAGLSPGDPRWDAAAAGVAAAALAGSPTEFVAVQAALDPVGGRLVGELLRRYPESRRAIEGGKLDVPGLVAEATGYDRAANLLARYATAPADLAELAVLADPRHFGLFAGRLRERRGEVVPLLAAEVAKGPPEEPPAGAPDAADAGPEAWGKRRGYAAAALVALGEAEGAWPVFRFPADGDPTARSYLQERLSAVGSDPLALMRRFEAETDASTRRALAVALGDFPPAAVPDGERAAFAARLLAVYREHPDPGLHSAVDWLLRQKWGKAAEVAAVDARLAQEAGGRAAGRAVARWAAGAAMPAAAIGAQLPAPPTKGRGWFVNGEGQTFAVVRGPTEFTLGEAALVERGRVVERSEINGPPHPKRLARTFAVATREVTAEEYLRFRPAHRWSKRYTPDPGSPAVAVTWYGAAAYCNWLSEREGVPPDQWCYEPNELGDYEHGMVIRPGYLGLAGYRLPTEAEWECACRAGAATARPYGRDAALLPRYAWAQNNSDGRAWPVGRLRPNDLGLFDALGNAGEWTMSPPLPYQAGQREDAEDPRDRAVFDLGFRAYRGATFGNAPLFVRCADRNAAHPRDSLNSVGFRPARTIPE